MVETHTPLWVQQNVISRVILLLCSFSRTIIFCFAICPWPIQPQGLGHLSNVRHGFHHAEWALSPFREWLVIPTLVLLLYQHIMQEVTMVDCRFCRWAGGYLSHLVTWGVPWTLVSGMKALVRHQFGFSVFIEICNLTSPCQNQAAVQKRQKDCKSQRGWMVPRKQSGSSTHNRLIRHMNS